MSRAALLLRKALLTLTQCQAALDGAIRLLDRAAKTLEDRDRAIAGLRAELNARSYSESPVITALRRIPEDDCYRA